MKKLTVLLALCCWTVSLSAQDYVELNYKFKTGDVFELQQQSRSETYITVSEVIQRTTRDYNTKMNMKVAETGAGVFVLEWSYADIKFNFNAKN